MNIIFLELKCSAIFKAISNEYNIFPLSSLMHTNKLSLVIRNRLLPEING